MDKDINKFLFTTEDGNTIEYEKLLSFHSNKNKKFYMIVTDNTKDEEGNLNTFAYYFMDDDLNIKPVLDEQELEMITNVYNNIKEEC